METPKESSPPPVASIEVIEWLEKHYPDRCPLPEIPDREVWMAAGAARVVRTLRAHYDRATTTAITKV